MTVKVLSPEQLFDSLAQVTGNIGERGGPKRPKRPMAARRTGRRATQFVNFFLAGAESASAIEYEAGIPQALRLMNSPIANNPALARRSRSASSTKPEEVIEKIYLPPCRAGRRPRRRRC